MKEITQAFYDAFFERHPDLAPIQREILKTAEIWTAALGSGGKLLLCGNGGSCADCDHIAGELMKGFQLRRPVSPGLKHALAAFGDWGNEIGEKLQQGLPVLSLCAHSASISAFANDVDAELVFAQQVTAYGDSGDVFVGISTSGNAKNVSAAMMVAKAKGLKTIALTGRDGGTIGKLADVSIIAPAMESYRIQEYHVSIYHLLCGMVEYELFDE